MVRAEAPAFRSTTGLDFKKRCKISDFSHHGSPRDAIALPEEA